MGKIRSRPDSSYIAEQLEQTKKAEAEKLVMKILADKSYDMARGLTAIVLFSLHEKYGFGHKRLMDFYYSIVPLVNELKDRYEMPDSGAGPFLCSVKLKDYTGIDVETLDFKDKLEVAIEGDK